MELNGLEREFLTRLAIEPWASPPLFDHTLIARLVETKLVTAARAPSGAIWYEITGEGLAEVRRGQSGVNQIT